MTATLIDSSVRSYSQFYIDGSWVDPAGEGVIEVISPLTEQVIARVPDPVTADIDRAVSAARRAFDDGAWSSASPAERGAVLSRLADEIEKRVPEFAHVFAAEVGAPLPLGDAFHQMSVSMFRQYAAIHEQFAFSETRVDNGMTLEVRREPVGVVGAINPWNAPVAAAAFKIGPALAAGCTVVLKPSPEGPLTAYLLAECVEAAGVPAGVVSILPGGREVGEYLVTHPDVDKIAFTGSTAAGRRIMSLCAERIARVTLELGGKSAAIIAEDVDPADVLPTLVPAGIGHSGQVCAAITRVLVPKSREAEYIAAFTTAFEGLSVGNPFDPETMLGPLAMERQRDRVEEYIAVGRAEGAVVSAGGGRPANTSTGWFVEPTLFTQVHNDMRIAREEIFGPVICIIAYDGLDEAIAIANDSPYGLSGSVYTNDPDVASRVTAEVRTGQIFVNNATTCVTQPFGGYKQSGMGREGGIEGMNGYLETKLIQPLAQ